MIFHRARMVSARGILALQGNNLRPIAETSEQLVRWRGRSVRAFRPVTVENGIGCRTEPIRKLQVRVMPDTIDLEQATVRKRRSPRPRALRRDVIHAAADHEDRSLHGTQCRAPIPIAE